MFARFFRLCWSYVKTGLLGMAAFAILSLAYGGIRFAPGRISVVTYGALLVLTALTTLRVLTMLLAVAKKYDDEQLHKLTESLREILRSWWNGPSVSHKTAH